MNKEERVKNLKEEIIEKLKDINDGKEPVNNDKWRLLKSQFR